MFLLVIWMFLFLVRATATLIIVIKDANHSFKRSLQRYTHARDLRWRDDHLTYQFFFYLCQTNKFKKKTVAKTNRSVEIHKK